MAPVARATEGPRGQPEEDNCVRGSHQEVAAHTSRSEGPSEASQQPGPGAAWLWAVRRCVLLAPGNALCGGPHAPQHPRVSWDGPLAPDAGLLTGREAPPSAPHALTAGGGHFLSDHFYFRIAPEGSGRLSPPALTLSCLRPSLAFPSRKSLACLIPSRRLCV